MLERMRHLYFYYPQLAGRISAPLVRKLPEARRLEAAIENSAPVVRNSRPPPRPLPDAKILELSWTHLPDLVRLDDPWKRAFYENEAQQLEQLIETDRAVWEQRHTEIQQPRTPIIS